MLNRGGLVVGTAGHIDHGKTALVYALTGMNTDTLKEEKKRGISIDLGFAHLSIPGCPPISFIDVPGHERFIKNMLAGAAGIQAVLLMLRQMSRLSRRPPNILTSAVYWEFVRAPLFSPRAISPRLRR
jgi:translation initiation factor 2 gamma subunit (eIF-2gamma)